MAYTAPTIEEFRARFPGKFDAPGVTDAQITYALGRAARQVDETWAEDDFKEARMLYAAAFLTAQGLGVAPAGSAEALAGVSSVRSGALSIDFKDAGASASKDPAMNTLYGRLYLDLLRANRSGARVTDTGLIPTAGCNGIIRGW